MIHFIKITVISNLFFIVLLIKLSFFQKKYPFLSYNPLNRGALYHDYTVFYVLIKEIIIKRIIVIVIVIENLLP